MRAAKRPASLQIVLDHVIEEQLVHVTSAPRTAIAARRATPIVSVPDVACIS